MKHLNSLKINIVLVSLMFFANFKANAQISTIVTKPTTKIDIEKKYLLGKFDPSKDSAFVKVENKYCLKRTEYMLQEVYDKYLIMYKAALEDNIKLGIISATRSFDLQKFFWEHNLAKHENKILGAKKILRFLAMPGTSRHHWGTDIDFVSTDPHYFNTEIGKKTYTWLCNNAHKYGFYQVYTNDRNGGYLEEKWHWTYLPISKIFLKQYKEKITNKDLNGFNGCELVNELNIIDNYVMNINKKLID